jgi:2-dehydropantoate 2-reductase
MRQVPVFLIIGNGRMARHMAFYLDHLGLAYRTFARATHDYSELPALLKQTTHVLILLRDDAIEDFITQHLRTSSHTLVHFSGSLNTPLAHGAHPLMTFVSEVYAPEIYQNIWFMLDSDKSLEELLPGLPNQCAHIPADAKALYHSMCVLSGNFTCLLWQKFSKTLQQRWQIPESAMHPYLQQIMTNIMSNSQTALTGPLIRNDQKTIAKNLQALQDDPYQEVYQAFVAAYQQQEKK